MTDCTTPHAGIELDLIDLSKPSTPSFFQGRLNLNKDKIDSKIFVKDLLEKILDNDAFLSFSAQIKDLNTILRMKYASASDIADVISKDKPLTTKLLKLVNASFYNQFFHKTIATISEAMIILGIEEIKLSATTLKFYELMQDIATIKPLKAKTRKALQRSMIARQIAFDEGIKDTEAIQISALLYDFGEYLVALCSPEVFIRIELCADENNLSREAASKSITGISYRSLGRFVASKWNLPASVLHAMKPVPEASDVNSKLTIEDRHRIICAVSNALCHIECTMEDDDVRKKIVTISEQYKHRLELPVSKTFERLKTSWVFFEGLHF